VESDPFDCGRQEARPVHSAILDTKSLRREAQGCKPILFFDTHKKANSSGRRGAPQWAWVVKKNPDRQTLAYARLSAAAARHGRPSSILTGAKE
jgi:hypothetical protein